jgi:hypothetical protein
MQPDFRPRNTPAVANIENAPPNIDVNNFPFVELEPMLTPTSHPEESVQGSSFSNSPSLNLSTSSGITEQDSSSTISRSSAPSTQQPFRSHANYPAATTPLMSHNDNNIMEYFEESSYVTESHNATTSSPISHFNLEDLSALDEEILNEVLKM